MKKIVLAVLVILVSFSCFAQKESKSVIEIKQLIEDYKVSINKADTILGAKVWADVPEVTFIHPKGHEKGWKEIKDNIYGLFRTTFTTRDLKSNNEVINVYKNVAWVEFYWVFDATFTDGKTIQTKGRETQILKKTGDEWRIMHVHYSGMPMTGERQGF